MDGAGIWILLCVVVVVSAIGAGYESQCKHDEKMLQLRLQLSAQSTTLPAEK